MSRKIGIALVLLAAAFVMSCVIGRYDLSLGDLAEILTGTCTDEMKHNVFFRIRLPRTVLVLCAGAALSLAGFVYQSIFRNPLVSPDVLGVGSGSSMGAIAGMLMTNGSAAVMQGAAFVAGLLTVCLSILLARAIGGAKNVSMILAGIVVGALSNSVIMTLKYVADPRQQLAAIEYWLMGTFSSAGWSDVKAVLPVLLIGAAVLYLLRRQVQLLTLEEEEALSLGVSVSGMRLVCILFATALVSAVVAVAGLVAWIGLIVPHIVRLFFGEDIMRNLPLSMICGATFLLAADIVSRSLFSAEIPISIVTSMMGGIFLLLVLCRRYRREEEIL